ncbi:MAG: hypothetical protein QXQ14_00050 [Candidatus Aenigmatarchaeota archaeon]
MIALLSSLTVFLFNYFLQKNKRITKLREELEKLKIKRSNQALNLLKEYVKLLSLYSIILIAFNTVIFFLAWLYLENLKIILPKFFEISWQYFYVFASFTILKIFNEIIKI